jgi:Outer membrane protein
MKNGLLAWNVALTLIAGYLLYLQFNGKSKNSADHRVAAGDSAVHTPFRIAYFEMDSVESNYAMVKDIKAEISKKDEEFSGSLNRLENKYRNKYLEYQQKEKAGTMVQADYERAQVELRKLEEELRNTKQDLDQKYQDFVMRKNLGVKKRIEDFLAEYNKAKGYTYIMAFEPGLFYYKDTLYNITGDVIRGLNEDYKNKKD